MNCTICTLFEGDYHFGVAALVNSLIRNGFRGTVWAGFRGVIPPWARSAQVDGDEYSFDAGAGCVVRFVPLSPRVHFTNYKPHFIQSLLDKQEWDAVFYFDPDITVKCCWTFFEDWVSNGVALVQDITNSNMPADHPIRCHWRRYGISRGLVPARELSQYFNAGFIGVSRGNAAVIKLWSEFLDGVAEEFSDLTTMMSSHRSNPFYAADQDVLNAAAMFTPVPLSTIGPEGMDFVPGGFTMSHSLGSPKPWQKIASLTALLGRGPSQADRSFWRYSDFPIRTRSGVARWARKADLALAVAIGRVIRRQW